MSSSHLQALSLTMLPDLEAEMRRILQDIPDQPNIFYGMLQYHMGWVDEDFQPVTVHGGKRIRPLLTLLSCQASGSVWTNAIPAAAAIEILHNFSLVHDDIEDGSPRRRGRKTLWRIWGEAQAINSGDAMFALSHLALTRLAERNIPPENILRAIRRFDETCVQLTMGQYLDMDFESRDEVLVDEYIEMITGKTAALLSLCAELGALIAGQNDESIGQYAQFGLNLGLAFQVIDDILGIWGDESVTGKSTATDIITKKKTLPVLYGLERSKRLRDLYQHAEADEEFVIEVIAQLDALGAKEYASDKAITYSNRARQNLQNAKPAGEAGEALLELADMLLLRDY